MAVIRVPCKKDFDAKANEICDWLKVNHGLSAEDDYHCWIERPQQTIDFKFYDEYSFGKTPKGFETIFSLMWS